MAIDFSQLRQVGDFGNFNRIRLPRSMKSPMDKCTVVSILPLEITEVKVTIDPGKFHIKKGTYEDPAVLVVGGSSYWREIISTEQLIEIPVSSVAVAESIIRDYCNGLPGCDMNESVPGLFFVLGEENLLSVKTKFKEQLAKAKIKQGNWYFNLVNQADALWARSNGNPLAIADLMRLAARELHMEDKPWLRDFQMIKMVPCPACGSLKNPAFPVCAVCRNVDQSHSGAKDLKFTP
jgi:hypothetical protein